MRAICKMRECVEKGSLYLIYICRKRGAFFIHLFVVSIVYNAFALSTWIGPIPRGNSTFSRVSAPRASAM